VCEMPSVYSEKWVKARKVHACCECSRPINSGETYNIFKGCWDGKFKHYKTCRLCMDLKDCLFDFYDDGIEFENLKEYATEAGYSFPPIEPRDENSGGIK
jgi:hypothetical protein